MRAGSRGFRDARARHGFGDRCLQSRLVATARVRLGQRRFALQQVEQIATTMQEMAATVREVSRHVQSGLDLWIVEGLEFLERHSGHSVVLTRKSSR